MLEVAIVLLTAVVSSTLADCDNDIHVQGVSLNPSNDKVNGIYKKLVGHQCDSRDVFNHTEHDIYLYHIEDGLSGYWLFREEWDCGNSDINDALVRSNDMEFNPGLIHSGWEERLQDGGWERNSEIDVKCYVLPSCRYHITGAWNTSLNAYYDVYQSGNAECTFRDMYKHEHSDLYLYFVWSDMEREYYWLVYSVPCVDAVDGGAYLRNDDYSFSPEFIIQTWQERLSSGSYEYNYDVDVDLCDEGLSPGAIAGIVIGCVAFAAIVGGLVWFFVFRND